MEKDACGFVATDLFRGLAADIMDQPAQDDRDPTQRESAGLDQLDLCPISRTATEKQE